MSCIKRRVQSIRMQASLLFSTSVKRCMGIAVVFFVAGCASSGQISGAIAAYQAQAPRIELGQSMEQVLDILLPTQSSVAMQFSKAPEEYIDNGKTKKIYFFRSRSFPDGLVTDDEFTPYVFEDGVLVAIGWTAIGGPKTQAQSRDNDYDYHFRGRVYYH